MAPPVDQLETRVSAAMKSPRGRIRFTSAKAAPTDTIWIIGSGRSANSARSDPVPVALVKLRVGSNRIVACRRPGRRDRTKRPAARVVTSLLRKFSRAHTQFFAIHLIPAGGRGLAYFPGFLACTTCSGIRETICSSMMISMEYRPACSNLICCRLKIRLRE